jgi:uncharacterized heparinase superfamily protein
LKPGLVLRTLAHLRREQLIYRPIRLVQSRLDGTLLSSRWTDTKSVRKRPTEDGVREIARVIRSLAHLNQPITELTDWLSDLENDRYTFLNKTRELKPIDWNVRYENHLWSYCLHYFGYSYWCARAFVELGDKAAFSRLKRSISSWIEEARPGKSDGWQPYPASLRIVNWIFAYSLVAGSTEDQVFFERWAGSLYRQLEFLQSRIEYHLLGNHILKNAKAMLIGGLFFQERRWIDLGRDLLVREIDEQVLADGGHFERAPMYHAQVAGDILESLQLLRAFGEIDQVTDKRIEVVLARMAGFLEAVSNPDGTLALFNDSANAYDLRPLPLLASLRSVVAQIPSVSTFPESGYFSWTTAGGSERILVDAGPPAATYNMAHAHCDLLSYELWIDGRALVVDSGVHGYEGDRFREYSRSTRAHNTVVFDGREQSEIWATFRVGARASSIAGEAHGSLTDWAFCGSYSPYFDHNLVHKRRIERDSRGTWRIADTVSGGAVETAESFIHLHPDVSASRGRGLAVVCDLNGRGLVIEPFGIDAAEILRAEENPPQGWHFPDFGIARPASTIRLSVRVRRGEEFGYTIRRA